MNTPSHIPLSQNSDRISKLIEHVFRQYPQISPSMLQIGLSMPAEDWKPVLDRMIQDKLILRWNVIRETPVSGRQQTYTTLLWAGSGVRYGQQPAPLADTSRVD